MIIGILSPMVVPTILIDHSLSNVGSSSMAFPRTCSTSLESVRTRSTQIGQGGIVIATFALIRGVVRIASTLVACSSVAVVSIVIMGKTTNAAMNVSTVYIASIFAMHRAVSSAVTPIFSLIVSDVTAVFFPQIFGTKNTAYSMKNSELMRINFRVKNLIFVAMNQCKP